MAYESISELSGSLEGVNAIGFSGLQTNLAGVNTALEGINPESLSGLGGSVAALNQPLGEIQGNLAGVNTALEGINPERLSGLGGSISALNQPLGEIQGSLAGVNTALEGINPEGLSGLGGSISALNQPLGEFQGNLAGVNTSLEGINPGNLSRLGTGISAILEKAQVGLNGLKNALAGIGKGGGALFDSIKIEILERGKQGLDSIHAGLEKIGQNSALTAVAGHLANAAGSFEAFSGKLAAMIDEPSKLSMSFESSMKNIQAITGKSDAELNTLSADLVAIGSRIAAGPQAAADAYNDVAGGITKVAAQMPIFQNAIALAEAGQADLGVASNGLVKIMNAYNFTAGEVVEINEKAAWTSDVLTQAVGMGVGSMNEFISAMAPVSGVAASVGIGFDEIGSTMAYMSATTDTAATAGTKLAAFMTVLQNPSDDLAQALKRVGITSGSAMLKEYGLAESARIVSAALGGNQDAITQAIGRQEAMAAVISLTGDAYTNFATEFGSTMEGVTAGAQAIQTQSFESKMARLEAASDALKIQLGGDINHIKGFFADMQISFLQNVATPILNSPVGGAISQIAAVVSVGGAQFLSMGSAALNTAAQMTTLAANIKNAGGYAQILQGAMTIMSAPFHAVGSAASKFAGSLFRIGASALPAAIGTGTLGGASAGAAGGMGAAAGASTALGAGLWATLSPILLVVGAIALIAGASYLIIKNWDSVSGFFVGLWKGIIGLFKGAIEGIKGIFMTMPNWVVGLLVIFFPFISIPILIISKWDTIKVFFISLWEGIKSTTASFVVWIGSLWDTAAAVFTGAWMDAGTFFTAVWSAIYTFFTGIWNGVVTIVLGVVNWFNGLWEPVAVMFTAVWSYVYTFFSGIWQGIQSVVLGFIDWIGGAVEFIIAPFVKVAETVGGVLDEIGGFFKGLIGESDTAGTAIGENLTKSISARTEVATPGITTKPVAQAAVQADKPGLWETIKGKAAGVIDWGKGLGGGKPEMPVLPQTTQITQAPVTAIMPETTTSTSVGSVPIPVAAKPMVEIQASSPVVSVARMNGNAGTVSRQASGSFLQAMSGTVSGSSVPSPLTVPTPVSAPRVATPTVPALDMEELITEATVQVRSPISEKTLSPASLSGKEEETKPTMNQSVTIQNMYVQNEDYKLVFDFVRMFMHAVHSPAEVTV
jgi:TP901 family phage tail tape measure protein